VFAGKEGAAWAATGLADAQRAFLRVQVRMQYLDWRRNVVAWAATGLVGVCRALQRVSAASIKFIQDREDMAIM